MLLKTSIFLLMSLQGFHTLHLSAHIEYLVGNVATLQKSELLPIPPRDEQTKSLNILLHTYKIRLADRNNKAKRQLAIDLRDKARSLESDQTGQFVHLDQARRIALEVSDLSLGFDIIGEMANRFSMDGRAYQVDALMIVARDCGKDMADTNSAFALGVLTGHLDAEDVAFSEQLLQAARPILQKLSDPEKQKWSSASRRVSTLQRVAGERKRLKANPDNSDALGIIGRYLCLIKEKFEEGLPMLSRSSDKVLQPLSGEDLLAPKELDAQLLLAERWLELAKKCVLAAC